MAKDIKVSYMKIVLLISSILALVMPYMIVEMTILLEISASYYLTGLITANVGAFGGSEYLPELVPFGVLFILGLIFGMISVDIEGSESLVYLKYISVILFLIVIIGYPATLFSLLMENAGDLGGVQIPFVPHGGFYFSIISVIAIVLEIFLKDKGYSLKVQAN